MEGEDPLAPFSPTAAAHLLRTDGFAHVADIMVNSFYDEQLDEGCAFEELISFHGGMGGPQTRPFLLHPVELEAPDEGIIGAEAAYRVLAGWRRALQGDAAPRGARPPPRLPPAATTGAAPATGHHRTGRELILRLRPRRLNTAIAALFMIGSFGFALGCISAYASAVGPTADSVTFFVSSIFFTTASFWQLVQSQSPGRGRDGDGARRRAAARPLPGLAAARQELARGRHAVPRDALLQRDDVLGDHGGALEQPVRQGRLAAGLLRLDPVPRLERVRDRSPWAASGAGGHARPGGGSRGSTCSGRSPSWRRRSAPS